MMGSYLVDLLGTHTVSCGPIGMDSWGAVASESCTCRWVSATLH